MNTSKKLILCLIFLLPLSACGGGSIHVNMNNYSNYNEQEKTFEIFSNIQGVSENNLEFKYVAYLIKKALISKGYTEDSNNPYEKIFVDYRISEPHTHYYTQQTPNYGVTGYSSATTNGTYSGISNSYGTYNSTTTLNPTYGVTGYTSHLKSYVLYDKFLNIKSYNTNNNLDPLWNAQMEVTSVDSNLRTVLLWTILAWSDHIGQDYHVTDKITESDPRLCTVFSLSNQYVDCEKIMTEQNNN